MSTRELVLRCLILFSNLNVSIISILKRSNFERRFSEPRNKIDKKKNGLYDLEKTYRTKINEFRLKSPIAT